MSVRSRFRPWRLPNVWWGIALAIFAAWAAARLGVFTLCSMVETPDGARWLPNALAGVDHPFHIARAETLRQSLLNGELLRWIGQHQGGYPVEFYPLGVAWLETAIWAISLGSVSIPQAHTVVVALIFLAPAIAFARMASLDGWTWRVALVALTFHVVVPGDWWHGGYTELVQWGLITNVGGAVAALFCLVWLTRYVATGDGWPAVGAVLAAVTAIYTNPRSLIALAVIGAGVWLTAIASSTGAGQSVRTATRRLLLVGTLAGLVAAPELLSLARFSHLYQFVRYERYADPGSYVQSTVAAVSMPVFLLAVAGVVLSLATVRHLAARTAAVTLVLYCLVTLVVMGEAGASLTQLEATRLMPFQRLLMVYLAAAAIERAVQAVSGHLGRPARLVPDLMVAALAVALVAGRVSSDVSTPPVPGQTDPLAAALYPVERAAVPQFADFEEAIRAADAAAAPGTGVLVIGSALSWHQRLWAPLWTNRPLYYDNWLWYWHAAHAGTPGYVWEQGHHYPDPERALTADYLGQHGIGAVVVTGPATAAAAASAWLELIRSGTYDTFRVRNPVTVVTLAGTNADRTETSGNGLTVTGTSGGGTALIRRNWYPRWNVTVNGQTVAVTRTDDGYMSVSVPAGDVTLHLSYGTDMIDWLGRVLCLIGLTGIVFVGRSHTLRTTTSRLTSRAGRR